jgi:hypothetical protein
MNDDPEATVQAVLYVGNPEKHHLRLPAGEYSVLAMDQDGNVSEVHASLPSEGVVPLDKVVFGSSATNSEREANKENMGKLVEFFAVKEYAVVSEIEMLLRTDGDLTQEDLALHFELMRDLQVTGEAALETLEYFSIGSTIAQAPAAYARAVPPGPSLGVAQPSVVAGPNAGFFGFMNGLRKFIGSLSSANQTYRQSALNGMAALKPQNQQWLFDRADLSSELRKELGTDDVKVFLRRLQQGDYDFMAGEIHTALSRTAAAEIEFEAPGNAYLEASQKGHNRPLLNLAHDQGTKVLVEGMKFYGEAIKLTVSVTYGGKAAEVIAFTVDKAILIYDLTQKPGETLTKEGLKKVLEATLKTFLRDIGVPESEVGDVIGLLADEIHSAAKAGRPAVAGALTPTSMPEAVLSMPTPKVTPQVTPQVTPSASPAVPTPQVTPDITPSASPTPEESPAPDTGWIEGYVQGIASGWLDKGYEGIDVAVAADDLRQCLTDRVVNLRLSRDEAIGECPAWLFEPSLPEETPSPSPTPSPTLSPSPSPEPTPSPTIEARQVTAVGQLGPSAYETGNPITKSFMRLEFNTAGGKVEGTGTFQYSYVTQDEVVCYKTHEATFTGTYFPETGRFEGTYQDHFWRNPDPEARGEPSEYVFQCQDEVSQGPYPWEATLVGNHITGAELAGGGVWREFELTVQG